jgi:hypothetical protein
VIETIHRQRMSDHQSEVPDHWTIEDAWVVTALGRWPRSLSRLFPAMDAVNAAVPTYAELDGALRRLLAAKYVEMVSRGFRLTRHGRAIRRRASRGVRGLREIPPRVVQELVDAGPPPAPSDWRLDEVQYEEALQAYY